MTRTSSHRGASHAAAKPARSHSHLRKFIASVLMASVVSSPLATPALAQSRTGMVRDTPVIITPTPGSSSGRTNLEAGANGTPIVNIATPNSNGTSYNSYERFNVDDRGLILNNSDDIVLTNLAGYIDGNRNLRGGTASLIINEVVGTERSYLNGFIEIAGAPAELVIANPNGLECNGCGFINSPTVSLAAAGTLRDAAGNLTGYDIGQGTIAVGGTGLNASGARLNLFARAVTLNAEVWADEITMVTGTGEARVDGDTITVTAPQTALADAPQFALDVAALGGMYARAIRMIGTEAGLGVNVDGRLAAFDSGLSLSADGTISINGLVTSEAQAEFTSASGFDNTGLVYADGAVGIDAAEVSTSGLVASGSDIAVNAENISSSATWAAGLARDGRLTQAGNLTLNAQDTLSINARAVASEAVSLAGESMAINASVEAGSLVVTGGDIVLDANGGLRSATTLDIETASLGNAGLISGNAVVVDTGELQNLAGRLEGASLAITADALSNVDGLIQSTGTLDIVAASIDNRGSEALTAEQIADGESVTARIVALNDGALNLDVADALSNSNAILGGNGAVSASVGALDMAGLGAQLVAGSDLTLDVAQDVSIDTGAVIAGGNSANIAIGGALTITDGALQGDLLTLNAASISLGAEGAIAAGRLVAVPNDDPDAPLQLVAMGAPGSSITTQALENAGRISLNSADIALEAGSLKNSGQIVHSGDGAFALSVTDSITNSGSIGSNGALGLTAASLDNSGAITALGALDIALAADLVNSGQILSGGALDITATTIVAGSSSDAATSQFEAGAAMAMAANSIDLGNSQLTGVTGISLDAATGDLVLAPGASLRSDGDIVLGAANRIEASGTEIISGALASFSAGDLVLDDAIVQMERFALDADSLSLQRTSLRHNGSDDFVLQSAGTLDYSGAEIYSAGTNFTIGASELINAGGSLLHAGSGALSIDAASINNRDGRIATNGALTLNAIRLDNTDGQITAALSGAITVADSLINDATRAPVISYDPGEDGIVDPETDAIATIETFGLIASSGALDVHAGALSNAAGSIEALGALSLDVDSLEGTEGRIIAQGDGASLNVTMSGSADAVGTLFSAGDADIIAADFALGDDMRIGALGDARITAFAGDIAIGNGQIDGGNAALTAANGMVSLGADGVLLASEALSLDAQTVSLAGGTVQAGSSLALTADQLSNQAGLVQSLGSMDIALGGRLDNAGGTIFSLGNATINAAALENSGVLAAGESGGAPADLTISISGAINNLATAESSGVIVATGALDIASNSLSNSGTILGDKLALRADTISNVDGLVQATASLSIAADTLENSSSQTLTAEQLAEGEVLAARIIAAGDAALSLDVADRLSNSNAVLGGNGAVSGTVGTLTVAGLGSQLVAGSDLSLTVADSVSIDSGAVVAGANSADIAIGGALSIADGALQADLLTLHAAAIELGTQGVITSGRLVQLPSDDPDADPQFAAVGAAGSSITTQLLDNAGRISLNSADITLEAGSLNNSGEIGHSGDGAFTLAIADAITNSGSIGSNGALGVTAASLDNAGAITALGALDITLEGDLANSGQILTADALTIAAADIVAGSAGDAITSQFEAGTAMAISADSMALGNSRMIALGAGGLELESSGTISADGAEIRSTARTTLIAANMDLGGSTVSGSEALIVRALAGDLVLGVDAFVGSTGDVTISAAATLNGSGAQILSEEGAANFAAETLILDDAIIQAEEFDFAAASISLQGTSLNHTGSGDFALISEGTLNYSGAKVFSAGTNFTVEAAELINQGGALLHGGSGTLSISADSINNRDGRIATNANLALNALALDNSDGQITAGQSAIISIAGTLTNVATREPVISYDPGADGVIDPETDTVTSVETFGLIASGGALDISEPDPKVIEQYQPFVIHTCFAKSRSEAWHGLVLPGLSIAGKVCDIHRI
ncbi:filamentous hemagglutinin N-terminal domain-containing protein [Alterisphingorhabdus coralli]|uniref:Filamentous hemagglutinin N-terminal domain-containing protein n=1 Tax=Alterisphingorhabdus coralli TaxID=3071408 RepID=A0AA97I0R9_9SPHN|nr:filamentous hemagglutinin N-terminal domain-containing protein [Parasphingorhabdus sp. SCSIO 66989]WOE74045.1 filamentous hemagglutinin N-terminal domain-containing protein [Parasphingorhabdus sp. SCSIO 66989]